MPVPPKAVHSVEEDDLLIEEPFFGQGYTSSYAPCGARVRLVNGDHLCSGRVEVFHERKWWPVCDDSWDNADALVVCKELSCGESAKAFSWAYYGESLEHFILDDVNCTGDEASLLDCPSQRLGKHNCQRGEEAGVNCTDPVQVKLTDGSSPCAGRVELLLHGSWGSVCVNDWDRNNANVVCRQLKCGTAKDAQDTPFFGQGPEPVIGSVNCKGDETILMQCQFNRIQQKGCIHAGVTCTGHKELRLTNSSQACTGTLLVKEGNFRYICGEHWTLGDSLVACRQLGCGEALSTNKVPANHSYSVWNFQPRCTGNENSLWQCPTEATNDQVCADNLVVRVECAGNISVRLVNGGHHCMGTLEVMEAGHWGTVCTRGWNLINANVVCHELGCGKAKFVPERGQLPLSSQTMLMNNVDCSGKEQVLWHCGFNRHTEACRDSQVQVVCQGGLEIRLVGGGSPCAGRLEVLYNGIWGTVCDKPASFYTANAVCHELNCKESNPFEMNWFYGAGTGKIWLSNVQCKQSSDSLWDCEKSFSTGHCDHSQDMSVTCKDHRELRLKGGPCFGLLEVLNAYPTVWRPVSVTYNYSTAINSTNIANVICRHMQCGYAKNYTFQMLSNKPSVAINCQGNETSVWNCDIQYLPKETDNAYEEEYSSSGDMSPYTSPIMPPTERSVSHEFISVTCSENITLRLKGGGHRCSGMVEVYYKGIWGAVCSQGWDMIAANIACKELGCGQVVSHVKTDLLPPVSGHAWLNNLHCRNSIESLWHCSSQKREDVTCSQQHGAEVTCSESLDFRLVRGQSRCSGTLEVFYNYQWATVCKSTWHPEDNARLCQRLGCGNSGSPTPGEKPEHDETWLIISCANKDTFFLECDWDEWKKSSCKTEAVAVICSEHKELRLKKSESPCSGQVEIYYQDKWKVLSGKSWDKRNADVACRQVHCGTALSFNDSAYFSKQSPWGEEFHCTGNESRLWDCRTAALEGADSLTHRVATVQCSEEIQMKLVGGRHKCAGGVQLFYQNQWGTVCNKYWKDNIMYADLVCKNQKCGQAVTQMKNVDMGSIPVWVNFLRRNFYPLHLWQCLSSAPENNVCKQHAGVICSESVKIRLTGGNSRCDGMLEVSYNGTWGSVCSNGWGAMSAQVACKELNCSTVNATSHGNFTGNSSGLTMWLTNVKCKGSESFLWECEGVWDPGDICSNKPPASMVCSEGFIPKIPPSYPTNLSSILVPVLLVILVVLGIIIWTRWGSTKKHKSERDIEPNIYDDVENIPMNSEKKDSLASKDSKEADMAASEQHILPGEEMKILPSDRSMNPTEESQSNLEAILLET
ncbi:deleted in malignant brain tumors 1 protein [Microcaecilia unicolor]|uniref:Deleted in malignant brain tumors 1 protein-like n=1 Tax=Microcaecilia unicolor TaxID=1415580 RepID=A0A6P7WXG0_9AMPH|nr:deleted in malignant brain tumors 1 protein-like [Microcaecilia unicolor]